MTNWYDPKVRDDALQEDYGPPIEVAVIPCETDQWNFPYPKDQPWVNNDGICSICREPVAYNEQGPPEENVYTRTAVPHTRRMAWYRISSDELAGLLQYREDW